MFNLSNKPQSSSDSIDQLLKFNSFILILFTFFTTKIPFDTKNYITHYSGETSNVINQVLYLYLFFSSLVVLIKRFDKTLSFLITERYLSLFILLCLVSAIWSDYTFLSIKRSFQIFVMFLVIVEVLTNIEPEILLKQLKIVVSLYLFYNLYACRFNPLAIDPTFHTWRGMEIDKNHLAQSSFYCLLSSIVLFNFEKTNLAKIYNSVLGLIAVVLIYKARSSTVIVVLAVIVSLGVIFKIDTIFYKFGFGKSILGMILLFILSFGVLFIIFSSEVFGLIPEYFGKDLTLSGRVPIWEYVWLEIEKKLLLGYGFATYWIMGNIRIDIFAATFEGFRVNQAHNGYLEIMLQLGVVGAIFFLFILIAYIYRMLKLNSNLAILILVSILTLNYTESVLFKTGEGITTFYFMTSYIALSVFYFKNKNS